MWIKALNGTFINGGNATCVLRQLNGEVYAHLATDKDDRELLCVLSKEGWEEFQRWFEREISDDVALADVGGFMAELGRRSGTGTQINLPEWVK